MLSWERDYGKIQINDDTSEAENHKAHENYLTMFNVTLKWMMFKKTKFYGFIGELPTNLSKGDNVNAV